MSAPDFPPPDATLAEVKAWKAERDGDAARALCDCGHQRARHTLEGIECDVPGCPCERFDDAPHEAPRVSNGPSLVCNACQRVRVGMFTPFCKGCLAMHGGAS